MSSHQKFYVLANKHKGKLGYFLLEMDVNLAENFDSFHYVIKWLNKLDIGDAELSVIDYTGTCLSKKAIIVSFKIIYENTYTVLVIELDTQRILFTHKSY